MFTWNRKCVLKASQTVSWKGLIPTDWSWQRNDNYLWLILKPSFCRFSSLRVKLFRRLQQIWFQQLQPPVERSHFYSITSAVGRTRSTEQTIWAGKFSSLLLDSRRVVALPAAGANAASARSGAGAKLRPGTPAPVVSLRLLAGSPDAVALKAPLRWRATGKRVTFATVSVYLLVSILNARSNLRLRLPFLVHTLCHPPGGPF